MGLLGSILDFIGATTEVIGEGLESGAQKLGKELDKTSEYISSSADEIRENRISNKLGLSSDEIAYLNTCLAVRKKNGKIRAEERIQLNKLIETLGISQSRAQQIEAEVF